MPIIWAACVKVGIQGLCRCWVHTDLNDIRCQPAPWSAMGRAAAVGMPESVSQLEPGSVLISDRDSRV